MIKRTFVILGLLLVGLMTMASSNQPAPVAAAEDCEPGPVPPILMVNQLQGVVLHKIQICPQLGTLALTFSQWVNGVLVQTRDATAIESAHWVARVYAIETEDANNRLASEVETGTKWVEWLRNKADTARTAEANWPGWSPATRDAAMVELFGTFARELDGLADVLIHLNKGR